MKNKVSIRFNAAEYLTLIAAIGNDKEMNGQPVSNTDKIRNLVNRVFTY